MSDILTSELVLAFIVGGGLGFLGGACYGAHRMAVAFRKQFVGK